MAESSLDDEFLIALGNLTIDWNFAESWLKHLLGVFVDHGIVAHILTAELGAVGIENALTAIANDVLGEVPELADRMKYAAKLYARLRGYRNYYVHGIIFHARYMDGSRPAGFTHVLSAKGNVKTQGARLEAFQINEIAVRATHLALFVRALEQYWTHDPEKDERPPLPDKPPLPPEVDKNSPWPQSPNIQPQASPA